MQARDANALFLAASLYFEPAARRQWQFKLRDLIAFGQIRIKVIFARKTRALLHLAMQRQSGFYGEIQRVPVEHRQSAGQAEAYRADILIGGIAETRGAGAKGFRQRSELDVHFESDDALVSRARQHFLLRGLNRS